MKRIIEDFNKENYTWAEWALFGFLYPLGIISACIIADYLFG